MFVTLCRLNCLCFALIQLGFEFHSDNCVTHSTSADLYEKLTRFPSLPSFNKNRLCPSLPVKTRWLLPSKLTFSRCIDLHWILLFSRCGRLLDLSSLPHLIGRITWKKICFLNFWTYFFQQLHSLISYVWAIQIIIEFGCFLLTYFFKTAFLCFHQAIWLSLKMFVVLQSLFQMFTRKIIYNQHQQALFTFLVIIVI